MSRNIKPRKVWLPDVVPSFSISETTPPWRYSSFPSPNTPQLPSSTFSIRMCREMNAPVLPESKKVNATVVSGLNLTGIYNFTFDESFVEVIQMNRRNHICLCRPSNPMVHFCCPGCLEDRTSPTEEDQKDLERVLAGYDFDEKDPAKVVDQMLDLLIRNLPLTLYSFAKGHQAITNRLVIPTIFFADVESVHRFACHITHACEDYYYHEEYLHTVYHGSMYDMDWTPLREFHKIWGGLQVARNRLHERVMMAYLGGGVGIGIIDPRTQEIADFLAQDVRVETSHGTFGMYLAAEGDTTEGQYMLKRYHLVPHGPIIGEVVKWSSEWIGDLLDDEDDDDN